MIIVMKKGAKDDCIKKVVEALENEGYKPHTIYGVERTVVAAVGDERKKVDVMEKLKAFEGVENVIPILKPYKLASKEAKPEKTKIKIKDDLYIGGDEITIIAGPCSVEGEEITVEIAKEVKKAGAHILRGGAFKPRTSPYSFQGFGIEGLKILARAGKEAGTPVISEILDKHDLPFFIEYVDIIQVGARNMQNFALLKELSKINKPILLKRGMCATIDEWLFAAEYLLSGGNENVILCERGIRTFETSTRNTLDLNAIPVLRDRTHLPVIVDPSHGTGHWDYVIPMAKAGIAAGADGIMVEVHPEPEKALSDGPQSLKYERFRQLIEELKPVAEAVGRTLALGENNETR